VTATWRLLIDDGPAEGAWNMALDRAVQLARQDDLVPPTLRLYEWVRPTVSLGRFQKLGSVDAAFCVANGIDLVRRHTGGRGVLHDDEVTYSVIAGLSDDIPRGTSASYSLLCGGLAAAYRRLGVDASLTSRPRGDGGSAACYLHATSADLSLGQRKLSGSAQVWLADTVLQHGSFTITRDIEREASAFRLTAEESERLSHETSTLFAALGTALSRECIRTAVCEGFSESLGMSLEPGEVTDREREVALRLHAETAALALGNPADAGSR
jgi:lipoate-protein ligase A